MKTKLFTLLLAVAASIGTMFAASGTCGETLTWNLTNDGVLTISGTGAMNDYELDLDFRISTAPWGFLAHHIKSLIINEGVTSIGNYAFYRCDSLTSVTVGNSVTSIGEGAFSECTGLTSVTIPNSVTNIGSAFSGCSGLTSVTIPNSVTSIGDYAFYKCSGLTSVTIGNSVKLIASYAFNGCTGLTSIEIPNSVTAIGGYAFYGCTGLTSIEIPNSVTSIGSSAFSGCGNLIEVTINSNFKAIHIISSLPYYSEEFTSNYTMKNIFGEQVEAYYLGEGVTSIGDYTFYECSSLTSVEIPNSVTNIGNQAFYNCTNLQKIYNHAQTPANAYSTSFDGVNKFSCTLYVPQNSIDMYKNAAVWRDFYYIEPLESVEAIEDVVDNNDSSKEETKLLRNGQILILRGDKVYTLQGAEVK